MRSLLWATECRCASLTTSLAVTRRSCHVVKPDFGKTVDDRLRAGLHKGDAIFPHLGEFLHVGDVALQPPLGERLRLISARRLRPAANLQGVARDGQ